jgi:C1A family cysteine protease
MKNTLLFLLGIAFLASQLQAAVNVEKVQSEIKAQGAQWTSKSNWVSELPLESVKKMLGNNEEIKDTLDYGDVYSRGETYETVDWRNMKGVNWLGPVLNQGNCGSCVAFATVGTLEAQVSITAGASFLNPKFSPEALFACGGGSCNNGWYPSSAANFIKSRGVVDNACAPYTMGSTGVSVACTQFCSNQNARTYKVAGSHTPTGMFHNSAQKLKDALKKGPVVTSMNVYEDFLTYSGGVYKATSRRPVGGHAVSIVGYSDEGRYWIVRNSWGEDWGEKGFVKVSWDDRSGVGASTIAFDLAPVENTVTILSPAENDYVSGDIKILSQGKTTGDYSYELSKSGKSLQVLQGNSLDTETLEDGKYELVATSVAHPETKSFVRGFTVSNHEPQMSISFTGHEVDLSEPVSGRPEFDVKVTSTPIQMQKIDFMVTTLDGKLVTKRTTDVVLNDMILGFRFNSIPDGDYMIFFRGYLPAAGQIFTVDSQKIKVTNKN